MNNEICSIGLTDQELCSIVGGGEVNASTYIVAGIAVGAIAGAALGGGIPGVVVGAACGGLVGAWVWAMA